jgi:hypothetical protein
MGLACGIPIRGAIEVGIGVEFWPGELYGPVLLNAHRLESTVAQYPRIVVSPQACHYMNTQAITLGTGIGGMLNATMAGLCISLVCIDHDGVPILDFLGKGFREIAGQCEGDKYPINRDCVIEGLVFVNKEYERFKKEGNYKLAGRYFLLKQYYETRKHLWL